MKLKKEIYLYQTLLDSDYKNVYDGYQFVLDYLTFLDGFPKQVIEFPQAPHKSAIDNNGNFTLRICKFSEEIRDYNYLVFFTELDDEEDIQLSSAKFAFIESVKSLNDSESNPECELFCKWDAWSNNYQMFKNFENNFNCVRRTFDQFVNPYMSTLLQGTNVSTERRIVDCVSNHPSHSGADVSILWQRIMFTSDVYDFATGLKFDGAIPSSALPIILFPIVAINRKTRKPDFKKIKLFDKDGFIGYLPYPNDVIKIEELDSSKVLSSDLTFFPPFNYDLRYNQSENVYELRVNEDYIIVKDTNTSEGNTIASGFSTNSFSIAQTDNRVNTFAYPANTPFWRADRYGTTIEDIYNSEESLFEYPFLYDSVLVNGNEIPIVQKYGRNGYSIYVNRKNRITHSFGIDNGDVISYKSMQNNGKVSTYVDSLQDFLLSNSNQLSYQMKNTIKNSIVGFLNTDIDASSAMPLEAQVAVGLVNAGVNIGFEAMKQNAVKRDADNMANKADIASTEACDDTEYQDDIIILRHDAKNYDPHNMESLALTIHKNGVPVSGCFNILEIARDCFDVVQTNDCMINGIFNPNDREEISRAFNRGITKWHIDHCNSQCASFYYRFDKHFSNLPRTFTDAEEVN